MPVTCQETLTRGLAKRRDLITKALAIDDALAPAHAQSGAVKWRADMDWVGADREYRRALELSPNESLAHQRYGGYLVWQGRAEEGLAHLGRAYELWPDNPGYIYTLVIHCIFARRPEEAVDYFRQLTILEPRYAPAYTGMGLAYAQRGDYQAAVESLEQSTELENADGLAMLAFLAYTHAAAGNEEGTRGALRKLDEQHAQGRTQWGALAAATAAIGDKERAFAELGKAVEGHEWWAFSSKVNPLYDSLRSDPCYLEVLRRVGLSP